jgi:hypothetical protein
MYFLLFWREKFEEAAVVAQREKNKEVKPYRVIRYLILNFIQD